MNDNSSKNENTLEQQGHMRFTNEQIKALGNYIYALKTEHGEIFYVGQGNGNRVFSHIYEAKRQHTADEDANLKLHAIREIWRKGEKVEYMILAHNIPGSPQEWDVKQHGSISDMIESAIYDMLIHSEYAKHLTCKIHAPKSTFLSSEDISRIGAHPVDPDIEYSRVFLVQIASSRQQGMELLEATRRAWIIGKRYINASYADPTYVVGLVDGISVAAYKLVSDWKLCQESVRPQNKRYEFGERFEKCEELKNLNWHKILRQFKKGSLRGSTPPIVKLHGNGTATIIKGAGVNNGQEFPLREQII